ncbi:MAG: hypothetical protein DLM60_16930 [Pseudonocardiales bacterium]|nr:MAG: hypothetical protein DLM60_16930 [Pseudonocardiales bacterium]
MVRARTEQCAFSQGLDAQIESLTIFSRKVGNEHGQLLAQAIHSGRCIDIGGIAPLKIDFRLVVERLTNPNQDAKDVLTRPLLTVLSGLPTPSTTTRAMNRQRR